MALEKSVRTALAELSAGPTDGGTAELALVYARQIDAGGELDRLGPQLLAVLESLLMSPKARAAAVKGVKGDSPARSPLDELRARRDARADRTTTVDTAAT